MKRPNQEEYPREIFDDEELQSLRENSLAGGLAAMHRRKRGRVIRRGALAAVPALVTGVVLIWSQLERPVPAPMAVSVAPVHAVVKFYPAVTTGDVPPVPSISDDELLALFADQGAGLLGEPGHQQLVVFSRPVAHQ